MYFNKVLVLLTVTCVLTQVNSARILCVFPTPSFSHQIVFREYTKALAKRGHELVIITPDPYLPKDRPKDNVTEIDVRFTYQSLIKEIENFKARNVLVRGVSFEMEHFDDEVITTLSETIVVAQLNHLPVKQILDDPNQHFDLLVIEGFYEYAFILTKIFKSPTILITSYYGTSDNYDTVGAVNRHPVIYPNNFRSYFDSTTLWDKICAIYKELFFYNMNKKLEIKLNKKFKKYYGPDAPTLIDLRNNVDMVFFNSHPMYDGNRPVPPNVVYLGSLHLLPVKELPKDLEIYLNNSKKGVVYVSLGTNVHTKIMDKDLLEVFINAFKQLPYDVLWKFHEDLDDDLKHVKTQQWLPQRDLLFHPNIKLFVTQAGRQSLDEAIDAGVPMVTIPALADQWYNAKKSADFGISTTVDIKTMTTDILLDAIFKVLNDSIYRKNVEKLRTIINDEPQKPIERAVWWTEYVLRHGGTKHLKSPLANMSWSEYLMLDVVATASVTIILTITLIVFIIYCLIKSCRLHNTIHEKIKKR